MFDGVMCSLSSCPWEAGGWVFYLGYRAATGGKKKEAPAPPAPKEEAAHHVSSCLICQQSWGSKGAFDMFYLPFSLGVEREWKCSTLPFFAKCTKDYIYIDYI